MKITVESVFSMQPSMIAFSAFGDVYLNGELVAWIGFWNKVEFEANQGENTIEIFYENAVNERTIIKFYATEDVQIFVRLGIKGCLNTKLTVSTFIKGKDLKIIEESGIVKAKKEWYE